MLRNRLKRAVSRRIKRHDRKYNKKKVNFNGILSKRFKTR